MYSIFIGVMLGTTSSQSEDLGYICDTGEFFDASFTSEPLGMHGAA